MKVIIAGGRSIEPERALRLVEDAIEASGLMDEITEVVHGGAKGIDSAANLWAVMNRLPVKVFVANWEKFGRAAGPLRNQEMASYADALIAILVDSGAGTKNMIKSAHDRMLLIYEHDHE